jgi:hypothetical protein
VSESVKYGVRDVSDGWSQRMRGLRGSQLRVRGPYGRSTPMGLTLFFFFLMFKQYFIFYYFIIFIFFNFLIYYPSPGLSSRTDILSYNDRFLASEEGKYGFTPCPGPRNDYKYGI